MGGIQIFVKEDKETKALNDRLKERAAQGKEKVEKEREFQRGKTLTWKDVNYVVPVPGGTRRLLHDVTGYVKSGQLVALMGASGAGKTTALDVLAQRKNIGVITGEVLLEGRPLSTSFARETAYGTWSFKSGHDQTRLTGLRSQPSRWMFMNLRPPSVRL